MRKRTALSLICLLGLPGCSLLEMDTCRYEPPKYFTHKVAMSGETLGQISAWYTGSAGNWRTIKAANDGLDETRIALGQKIRIPAMLLKRRDPMKMKSAALAAPKVLAADAMPVVPDADARKVRPAAEARANVNWNEVGDYLYPDQLRKARSN